jgi:hypothetical protein
MGKAYSTYRSDEKYIHILVAKYERKRPLAKPRRERIILKRFLKQCGGRVWIGFIWFGIGTSCGLVEQGNEPSVFHKRLGISL